MIVAIVILGFAFWIVARAQRVQRYQEYTAERVRGCAVCRAHPAPGPGLVCRVCGEPS